MRLIVPALLLAALALSACVYRPDIKQGNFLKPEMIEQVKPGMTEAQVRFVLGPPMIRDPFHTDRWDYVYYNLPSSLAPKQGVSREHVVVYFKDGKVVSIEKLPMTGATDG
ncbi:MAG TPA: outer membrane protein assembly factor BamE [Gammaproteobacteria bacterium]|nr:outer membrane protein assembly factor BamE [Gammaproteobacteria bacterium]